MPSDFRHYLILARRVLCTPIGLNLLCFCFRWEEMWLYWNKNVKLKRLVIGAVVVHIGLGMNVKVYLMFDDLLLPGGLVVGDE